LLYSGKFNLRIPPKLHSEIAAIATAEEKSINQWVTETLVPHPSIKVINQIL